MNKDPFDDFLKALDDADPYELNRVLSDEDVREDIKFRIMGLLACEHSVLAMGQALSFYHDATEEMEEEDDEDLDKDESEENGFGLT